MPLREDEKKKLIEELETEAPIKPDDEIGELESHLRSLSLGGDYVIKTVADTFEALDPTGKSQSYEEATGVNLDEELKLLQEKSPMGETSGTAEAMRHVVPAAATALPLEKTYRALQTSTSIAKKIGGEMVLGGIEETGASLMTGDLRKEGAVSNVDVDLEKTIKTFATGSLITAPISTAVRAPDIIRKAKEAPSNISKFMDEAQDLEMQQAGGGKPPEFDGGHKIPDETDNFKYFDKEFIDDAIDSSSKKLDEAEMRKEGLEEVDRTFQRIDREGSLDKEIKDIQDTFNKLDDIPEEVVYSTNKDLFEGVSLDEAKNMFAENKALYEQLKLDIETGLYGRMDEIDFIKRGDDRIEIGAKEDLYPNREPDSTKAEALALDIKKRRVQAKVKASNTQDATIKARQIDYEKALGEADDALDRFNKSKTPEELEFNRIELDRSLKLVEPYKQDGVARGSLETLDGFVEVGETKSFGAIKDADGNLSPRIKDDYIPVPAIKDTLKKGSTEWKAREAKVEKQRELNKAAHEELISKKKKTNVKKAYHGSPDKIDKFKTSGLTRVSTEGVEGAYFSFDKKLADTYATKDLKTMKKRSGFLHEVELDTSDFFDPSTAKPYSKEELLELGFTENELKYVEASRVNWRNKKEKGQYDLASVIAMSGSNKVRTFKQNTDLLKKMGYKGMFTDKGKVGIAFDDSSIKILSVEEKINKSIKSGKVEDLPKQMKDDIADFNKQADELGEKFANFFADVSKSKTADSFRKLHKAAKKAFDSASRFKSVVQDQVHNATKDMPADYSKKMYKHLLRTDYESIQEFKTKKEADAFVQSNMKIYEKAKTEIELLAKSMKDARYMNNSNWRSNGFAIAKKVGLDGSQAKVIEKLVSIRAMDASDWSFVKENREHGSFKLAMDLMAYRNKMSDKLFVNNPYNRTKGYIAEVFSNTPPEFTYKRGAIPPEMQTKVKGDTELRPKGLSDQAVLEYAELNNMGVVLNAQGNPKLVRTVASEAYRVDKLGKSYDFGEVMGETLAASVRKNNINTYYMKQISDVLEDTNNGLFNGSGKNFKGLTDKELEMLPKQLRDKIHSVHRDYAQMTLGNIETHIKTSKQAFVTAQLLTKDLTRMFKENVVLKNPVSYVNNFLFNYAIGAQNGISPKRMFKYQTKAISEYNGMRKLQENMIDALIKNDMKAYEALKAKAQDNMLYKLHGEGLAMSVISDITSAPSYSARLTDKRLKKLVTDLFGEKVADKIGNIAAEVYLNPNARTGKFLLDTFTKIDVFGRYGIAMDAMENGMSISQAVNKSNGIFGDLDKLSPMWVQGISEFGAVPFANWYYRIAGGLGNNIKDNIGKAVALGAGLYIAQEVIGKRTESFNPMLTIINTPYDMVGMSPYLNMASIPETIATPELYDKITSGNPTKLLVSDTY